MTQLWLDSDELFKEADPWNTAWDNGNPFVGENANTVDEDTWEEDDDLDELEDE